MSKCMCSIKLTNTMDSGFYYYSTFYIQPCWKVCIVNNKIFISSMFNIVAAIECVAYQQLTTS